MSKVNKTMEHLQPNTREWVENLIQTFVLDGHHLKLLQIAAECWDRTRQARSLLEADGLVIIDRYGQSRAHPAIAIEKDNRSQFMRALRELNIDTEGPAESRPPALRQVRRTG